MPDVIERVQVPSPQAAWEDLRGRVTAPGWAAVLDAVRDPIERLHDAARSPRAASAGGQAEIHDAYDEIAGLLAATPLGASGRWPEDFWQSALGKLLYYAFEKSHGALLLSQTQAAQELGVTITRLGALQRELKVEYIIDPDARHSHRARRRMTRRMVERAMGALKRAG